MTNGQKTVDLLHRALVRRLEERTERTLDPAEIRRAAAALLDEGAAAAAPASRDRIIEEVVDRITAWGPLTALLRDPTVTEVMVNGTRSVYVERAGRLERVSDLFSSDEEILQIISRIVGRIGRRIDAASPLVDARLPDGSRVNAIIAPLSLTGPVLTIRRFPERPLTLPDLVAAGTLTAETAAYLADVVSSKRNIVISGGTGSGKTTLLNALASTIPADERIITIEDAAELRLTHPHLISLEARPPNLEGKGEVPVRLLLINALRMRPDRIIVGEIRGGEALDMLQAMNTGHQGSLTTVHANAPLESLLRIETMALMSDVELPLAAVREQIRQAVHCIVQIERRRDGRRVVAATAELDREPPQGGGSYTLIKHFEI